MAVGDLHDLALEYLDVCADALALTPKGTPSRQIVSTAEPAWDCCDQLAVYVASPVQAETIPTAPQLAPGFRVQKWGSVNLITLVAVVTRCVPTVGANGMPPPAADITDAAADTDADIWTLWNYLQAAVRARTVFAPPQAGRDREVYVDGAIGQNAQGGCAGWSFQVRVQLDGFNPFA